MKLERYMKIAIEAEIKNLRNADDKILNELNGNSVRRRTQWFQENKGDFDFITDDLLYSAYRLLLERFHITPNEAPVIKKTDQEIVFHSMNFCPTLEACKILGLDTKIYMQKAK